jgi:hypothetical protein
MTDVHGSIVASPHAYRSGDGVVIDSVALAVSYGHNVVPGRRGHPRCGRDTFTAGTTSIALTSTGMGAPISLTKALAMVTSVC